MDTDRSMRSILVLVDPAKLSLAAAEDSALDAQLVGRLNGFDEGLLTTASVLANELRNGYPRGTVYWNEAAGRFLSGLAARHTSGRKEDAADMFTAVALKRVRDYIMAHLDEPLDVATLAAMCGRSQFHFSRVFVRSVRIPTQPATYSDLNPVGNQPFLVGPKGEIVGTDSASIAINAAEKRIKTSSLANVTFRHGDPYRATIWMRTARQSR
jgi:hypothetical protein